MQKEKKPGKKNERKRLKIIIGPYCKSFDVLDTKSIWVQRKLFISWAYMSRLKVNLDSNIFHDSSIRNLDYMIIFYVGVYFLEFF